MDTIRLTVKNYRGFSDSQPLRIEIGPGFTALLGPNNSGKSSLKLLFYELRNLFTQLTQLNAAANPNAYASLFGQGTTVNYQGITDVAELFNNNSLSRPITIEFEILNYLETPGVNILNRVIGTCDQNSPHVWKFQTYGSLTGDRNLTGIGYGVGQKSVANIQAGVGSLNISRFTEAMQILRDAKYYGPFRNAINQGAATHFDMQTGTAFIELWNEWKTSGIKSKTLAINRVTEEIRALFEFDQLEINASQSLKTLIVTINGHSYRLNELGSGLSQFIMVLGNAATTKPTLLLLDEPETNLHPSLQIDFLLSVVNYAQYGCVFSTHSVGLARSVADRIYSFRKQKNQITVKPFEAIPNYVEFVGELSFSTFKELGGNRLLLVEGVNDVKTVQQLLRIVKKEHTTVILPLGGDQLATGGREAELSELTRLSSNIFAIVDSERPDVNSPPSQRRAQFSEICKRLNIEACVTERRAIENYFPESAVKSAFGDNFKGLAPFERLSDSATPWAKSDSWKIARQMAEDDIADTDLWKFIARI